MSHLSRGLVQRRRMLPATDTMIPLTWKMIAVNNFELFITLESVVKTGGTVPAGGISKVILVYKYYSMK